MVRKGKKWKRLALVSCVLCVLVSLFVGSASAVALTVSGSLTAPEGAEDLSYTAENDNGSNRGTVTIDGNCVTLTAQRYSKTLIGIGYWTVTTTTWTVQNNHGTAATISYTTTGNVSPSTGTVTIGAGETTEFKLKGGDTGAAFGSAGTETATGTITINSVSYAKAETKSSVTLEQPSHGTYSVTAGGETLAVGSTYSNLVDTTYTFQAGAGDDGYWFAGWYVNGTLVSRDSTWSASFTADSTVTAKYEEDVLYAVGSAPEGSSVRDYLEVNSRYLHQDASGKESYYTTTDTKQVTNTYGDNCYFADPEWTVSGSAITSSASSSSLGQMQGDWQGTLGYSNAYSYAYSDMIRIKALKNCVISFDYSVSVSELNDLQGDSTAPGAYLYGYVGPSGSVSRGTVRGSSNYLIGGGSGEKTATGTKQLALQAGDYLYLELHGVNMDSKAYTGIGMSGFVKSDWSYSATISNFTVSEPDQEYTLTYGCVDPAGADLTGGSSKITVNNGDKSVSGGPVTMNTVSAYEVLFAAKTAPSDKYTFCGWEITDANGNKTYSRETSCKVTMNQNYAVRAIYAPAVTITSGGENGYGGATYAYTGNSLSATAVSSQYIARSADWSKMYTTLADAFSEQNTVVLMGGHTFSGDFTIPSEKTLVIPCAANDLVTASNGVTEKTSTSTGASKYCSATVNGNLTVDGALIVNGRQSHKVSGGGVSGGAGVLTLSGTSTLNVNGTLNAFGLINGDSGKVTAGSTAKVYELLQIKDIRSVQSLYSLASTDKSEKVFPFNQFFIQNIETETVYQSGATLDALFDAAIPMTSGVTGVLPMIGTSGCMFNLSAGTMTKDFDRSGDTTIYRVNDGGAAETGTFDISLELTIADRTETVTVNTADYYLPLNYGYSLDVASGGSLTMNYQFKLLPGASINVQKGGELTVADGAEVVLYRLNDYDTRSKDSGQNPVGYSYNGLVGSSNQAQSMPGQSYSRKTLDTLGSAKLNVDGTLTVNGGLYVTNDLVSKSNQGQGDERTTLNADLTVYSNGYNVLTGTGTIDMTSADTGTTSINEMMDSSKGDKTYAYDTVDVVPIKGLPEGSTSDSPDLYKGFTTGNIYGGTYDETYKIYIWDLKKVAQIVGAEGTYATLAAAITANTNNGVIQLIGDTDETVTISSDVVLDLNGQTVTLNSDSNITGTISGIDTSVAVKDYTTEPTGKLVGVTPAKLYQTADSGTYQRYVAIGDTTNGFSFHKFNISVTSCRVLLDNTTNTGTLYFTATFQGDNTVRTNGIQNLSFTNATDTWAVPTSGNTYEGLLGNISLTDNATNLAAKQNICAKMTFSDGTAQISEVRQLSYLDALKTALSLNNLTVFPTNSTSTKSAEQIVNQFISDYSLSTQWKDAVELTDAH